MVAEAGFVFALESQPQWSHSAGMSKTATIRAHIKPDLKREVENILSELGLTASETINVLYRQIKLNRGLPFEVRIPKKLTARTLANSKAGKNVRHFKTKKELHADLGL